MSGPSDSVITFRSNTPPDFSNFTFTGGGSLMSLETRSPNVSIAFGSAAPGDYALTDALLTQIGSAGFDLYSFGRSTSGLLSVADLGLGAIFSTPIRLTGTTATIGTVSASHALTLDFSGSVAQTGPLQVSDLILRGAGTYDLSDTGNQVTNVAGSVSGQVTLVNASTLNVNNLNPTANGLTLAGQSELRALTGNVFVAAPLTIASGTTTLTADDIDVIGQVSGPGNLVLQPLSTSADVRVGSPGVPAGFAIRSNDLPQFTSTLGSLTIGRADGTGTLTLDGPLTLPVSTTLRMNGAGGRVVIPHAITLTGATSSFGASGGGGVDLSANITTQGGPIFLGGPITQRANITLDSTNAGGTPAGGAVQFFGTLNADDAAQARQLTILTGTAGGFTAFDDIGTTASLGSFQVIGSSANTRQVNTTGNQIYDADVTVAEGHTSTFTNLTYLRGFQIGDTSATLNAGGDITFSQAIVDAGPQSLSIRPLSGTARVQGIDIGGIITIEAQTLELDGDLASPSAISLATTRTILQRDVRMTSATVFLGVVDSEAGEANDLVINASISTALNGDIGQAANGRLGSLSSDAAGTVTIAAARITLANNLAIGDACTLASNLEVTAGGAITFGGTVDSDATPRTLNLTSTGDTVRFGGLVGNGAALTTLIAAGTSIELNDDIRTTGAQAYNGPVLLTDDVRLAASAINFASTLDSFVFERNLIIDTGANGLLAFTSTVGSNLALRSMDLTARTITVQAGATTTGAQRYAGVTRTTGAIRSTTNGNIEFTDDVILQGATSVAGAGNTTTQGVTFKGRINSDTTSHPLTVNAGPNGAIRFEKTIGPGGTGIVAPSALTASGGAIDILENITTTSSQLYTGAISLKANLSVSGTGSIGLAGPTTLLSDSTLTTTAGDILFGSTLNSDDTARALIVNTGGNATTRFSGAVGSTNRLSSLTTNADGTTVLAATQVRTINDQVYNDAVRLGTNATLEANDVVFSGTLNSDASTTPRNLIVNTATISGDAGDTTFSGRVGGVARLGSITTNADGTTRIGADISTTRAISFNDTVVLLNSSTIDAGSGPIFFRAALDADSSATDPNLTLLSSAAGDLDSPAFRFGASIGSTRRLGSLSLGADRATPARAASIVFSDAFDSQGRVQLSGVANTDTFNITTGPSGFTMGAGHKLTAFGSVRVTSTGTVSVGDITALGAISLNGNAISIRRRPGGEVRQRDRSLTSDTGVDFVAGGAIDFNRIPTLTGSGAAPTFTPGNNQLDTELRGFISRLPLRPLAVGDFQDPNNTQLLLNLDQRSTGSTRTIISDAILTVNPEVAPPRPARPRPASAEDLTLLAELGIPVEPATTRDQAESLAGRSFDDRLPMVGFLPSSVPADRLASKPVRRFANAYRALALEPLTDAGGNPVLDDLGNPRTVSRLDTLREILGSSWQRYTSTTTIPSGSGWRHTLESMGTTGNPQDQAALEALNQARDFLRALEDLGLAPATLDVPKAKVLGELQPAQITDPRTLEEAILGAPRLSVMR